MDQTIRRKAIFKTINLQKKKLGDKDKRLNTRLCHQLEIRIAHPRDSERQHKFEQSQ